MNLKDLLKFLKVLLGLTTKQKHKSKSENSKPINVQSVKKKTSNMLYAKNDSERLKDELMSLASKNKGLHGLVIDLYKWISITYGKDTTITMIYRTQEEQDNIYKGIKRGSREYDINPWISGHSLWVALDIRTSIYTSEEINSIKKYINNKYNSLNYFKSTVIYHEITTSKGEKLGKHFHIRFKKK